MNQNKKCKNCKFYDKGTCKRYPKYHTKGKDDWCGEWEKIFIPIKPGTKTWRNDRRPALKG